MRLLEVLQSACVAGFWFDVLVGCDEEAIGVVYVMVVQCWCCVRVALPAFFGVFVNSSSDGSDFELVLQGFMPKVV